MEREAQTAKQETSFLEAVKQFGENKPAIDSSEGMQSRWYTDYGIAQYQLRDFSGAEKALEEALKTGAAPAEAFGYLGLLYQETGAFPKAIAALEKGLQLAPGDKVLLATLANTFGALAKQSTKGDVTYTERAVRTYSLAAAAALEDGEPGNARQLLRAALEIQKDDEQALSMLVLLLREQGEEQEAADLLDRTLKEFPTHAWARALWATQLRDRGDIPAAIEEFGKVVVSSSDLAWVWLECAKIQATTDADAAHVLVRRAEEWLGARDPRILLARAQIALKERSVVDFVRAFAAQSAPLGSAWVSKFRALLESSPEWAKSVPNDAVRALREAITKSPENLDFKELLVWLLLQQRNFSKAAKVLNQALASAPESVSLLASRAELHVKRHQLSKAADILDRALVGTPDSARLLCLRANVFEQERNFHEAVKFYRRALGAQPDDDTAFGGLIRALDAAGRRDDALNEIERKIARVRDHRLAWAEKGRLLVAANRLDEAAAALQNAERVLEGASDTSLLLRVRINLGETFRNLEHYDEAIGVFQRAILIDNRLCDAHAYISRVLMDVAEYDDADRFLAQAIGRVIAHSNEDGARTRLGWLYSARGWALRCAGRALEQVKEMYRKAVEFAPGDPYALKNLGRLLLYLGERAEGESLIRQLIAGTFPGQLPASLVGWCHYLLGNEEAAEYWLDAAISAEPGEISVQFDLALTLLAAGQDDGARDACRKAIEAVEMKPAKRQQGLLHVAIIDLIEAAEEGRVGERGRPMWQQLRQALRAANFAPQRLDSLQYQPSKPQA